MRKYNHILLSFLVALCCSQCTTRLSSRERAWMPYEGTENLVFQSNRGQTDTMFLVEKRDGTSNPGEYGEKHTYESVSVEYRHTKHYDTEDTAGLGWDDLISIYAGPGEPHISLWLEARNAFWTGEDWVIDNLEDIKPKAFETRYGSYDDVYIFKATTEDREGWRWPNGFVTKVYWSKSEGLLRYDVENGEYWELKNKYVRREQRKFPPNKFK